MSCCGDSELPQRVVGEKAGGFCCTDILFVVLFIANLIPVFYLYGEFAKDNDIASHLNSSTFRITADEFSDDIQVAAAASGYALLGSIGLTIFWLLLCRFAATFLIIIAQLIIIVTCIITGIALISSPSEELGDEGSVAIAIACFILAALLAMWLICIRSRIAFTATVLSSVAKILSKTPELLLLKAGVSGIVLGFACLWAGAYVELLAIVDEYDHDNNTDAYGYWALANIWALITGFWVQFTLLNVALVTTCATVGAWYFSPDTFSSGCFLLRPPVYWGFIRSVTFSFGSIAFGSLVLAIMRTIIVCVQYLANKAEESGGKLAKLACCCFICCLKCLESCLNWLTEYAFVYVALYGISFCSAGAKVWKLLADSGAKAIIQQSLLSPLGWMAGALGLAVGALCGWGAHEREGYEGLSDEARHLQLAVAIICGSAVGYLVMVLGVTTTIDAGCKTLLVCYAEEPEHLKEVDPELYEKFSGVKAKAKDTKRAQTNDVQLTVAP